MWTLWAPWTPAWDWKYSICIYFDIILTVQSVKLTDYPLLPNIFHMEFLISKFNGNQAACPLIRTCLCKKHCKMHLMVMIMITNSLIIFWRGEDGDEADLVSLYVPLIMASSINCFFFRLSSPSGCTSNWLHW